MKFSHFLLAMAAVGSIVFASCKNSTSPTSSNSPGGGALHGSFTATVNGQPWQSANDSYVENTPVFYGDYDSSEMELQIMPAIPYGDTGFHPFVDSLVFASFKAGKNYYDDVPNSGTIDLIIFTANHIKATYNFTGKDAKTGNTITITNGKVDYSY